LLFSRSPLSIKKKETLSFFIFLGFCTVPKRSRLEHSLSAADFCCLPTVVCHDLFCGCACAVEGGTACIRPARVGWLTGWPIADSSLIGHEKWHLLFFLLFTHVGYDDVSGCEHVTPIVIRDGPLRTPGLSLSVARHDVVMQMPDVSVMLGRMVFSVWACGMFFGHTSL